MRYSKRNTEHFDQLSFESLPISLFIGGVPLHSFIKFYDGLFTLKKSHVTVQASPDSCYK